MRKHITAIISNLAIIATRFLMEPVFPLAEKAHAAGVTLGAFAKDVPGSRKLMELGVRYVMCGVDVGIYLDMWRERVTALK